MEPKRGVKLGKKPRLILTHREMKLLLDAGQFVLAGEWPFDEDTEEIEWSILERAVVKLQKRLYESRA